MEDNHELSYMCLYRAHRRRAQAVELKVAASPMLKV